MVNDGRQDTDTTQPEPEPRELTLAYMLNGPWEPIASLTEAQAREELETWRLIGGYLSDEARYYLAHIGDLCRVTRRDYKSSVGTFIQPVLRMGGVQVGVDEKVYDQSAGKWYWERRITTYEPSAIYALDFIAERIEAEDSAVHEIAEMHFEEIQSQANIFQEKP